VTVGPVFADGERVRLLKLDDWFCEGMPPEDVTRLKTMIGQEWTVEAFRSETGEYELVFEHSPDHFSPFEWVWVPPEWIERVN
jgi:hypothetical protein